MLHGVERYVRVVRQEKIVMKPPDIMCTMKTLFPFKDGSQNVFKPKIFVVIPASLSVDLTAWRSVTTSVNLNQDTINSFDLPLYVQ